MSGYIELKSRRHGKSFAQRYGGSMSNMFVQSIGRVYRPVFINVDENGIPDTYEDLVALCEGTERLVWNVDLSDIEKRVMAHYVIDEAYYRKGK